MNFQDLKELKDLISLDQGVALYDGVSPPKPNTVRITSTLNSNKCDGIVDVRLTLKDDILSITNFYLLKQHIGTGTKIVEWCIDYCMNHNISTLQIRSVATDKIGMRKLCKNFNFEEESFLECSNFSKHIQPIVT